MSGASRDHTRIVRNITVELVAQLLFPLDLRTKVSQTGLYTYPDIVVVCGEPQFEDGQLDTLLNPALIVEVLSESTESHDRGRKFAHYRSIESLQEYILVSQLERRIERFFRKREDWVSIAHK